ncbi:unnamed protein product [Euphydryas editha]|uniref:Transposase n=1 Tax=Euphydryas editha TaxID=104508 RepID=A0AAU9UBY3_EUPED|nr:unnamed protein product [Euphydryas editha]
MWNYRQDLDPPFSNKRPIDDLESSLLTDAEDFKGVPSSARKFMTPVFFVEYLVIGATITGSYYADQIRRFRVTIIEKRRSKLRARVLFHEDNAPAH